MTNPIESIPAARTLALTATKNVEDIVREMNDKYLRNSNDGVPMALVISLASAQAACANAWATIAIAEANQ